MKTLKIHGVIPKRLLGYQNIRAYMKIYFKEIVNY